MINGTDSYSVIESIIARVMPIKLLSFLMNHLVTIPVTPAFIATTINSTTIAFPFMLPFSEIELAISIIT